MNIYWIFSLGLSWLFRINQIECLGEIIYALNAGGESFTDSLGIRYRRDYLTVGTASDYGRSLDIKRVAAQDKIIYQTERYSTETFGYNIPMPSSDGDYVLWLKFSEVWFNAPSQKVFDVALNDVIVVKDLDIFANVGRGVAHDEIIEFQIRQNKLIIEGKSSPFSGEIRVDFVKTERDNPKINAIVLMKGTADQVPKLPVYKPEKPLFDEEFEEEEEKKEERSNEEEEDSDEDMDEQVKLKRKLKSEDEEESKSQSRKKKVINQEAEPEVVLDPYASDESSYLIPILVTLGAFIPLLFCLCKLR